jgi:hypothetical protein
MLLAASVATIIISAGVWPLRDGTLTAVALAFVLLTVLQGAYLAGLMVACAWLRSGLPAVRRWVFMTGDRLSAGRGPTRWSMATNRDGAEAAANGHSRR